MGLFIFGAVKTRVQALIYRSAIGLIFFTAVSPLFAQSAAAAEQEIVVTVTRQPSAISLTPAAVDVVNVERVRSALPAVDVSEFLSRLPGLNIQNRQNYAQDTQISSRGFGARATFGIRGIKIFVDDIPVSIPDGQAQGAVIPLAAINRIEVLRGPWAVAYGNAAGGVISATTSIVASGSVVEARAIGGADGQRVNSLFFAAPDSGGLLSYQRFSTSGFRDHSASVREHSYLRFDAALSPSVTLTLSANVIDQPESQDALGLTRQQLAQNPRQAGTNAELFNTRKSIHHRQFGGVVSAVATGISIKAIAYAGERDVTQFLATPVAAQGSPTSAGGVVDLERRFWGAGLRLAQQRGSIAWSLGVDVDHADDARRGFENYLQDSNRLVLGVRGNLRRDESNIQRSADVFGQLSAQISPTWHFHFGARQSHLDFSVVDRYVRAGNGDDSGGRRFAAFSPALALVKSLNEQGRKDVQASMYLSVARGFETPTAAEMAYRLDQASGLNMDLKPGRNNQIEFGYRRLVAGLSAKLAAFQITSQNEIVQASVVAGRSSFQNAAATLRRGFELSLTWRPATEWDAALAWTVTHANVSDAYLAGTGTNARRIEAGSSMPAVPRQNFFGEIAWRRNLPGWSANLGLQARSTMPADDANTAFAAGYATLVAAVNFKQVVNSMARPIEFDTFVRAENLLDRQYVGSVITNEANQRFYEPAAGRRVMAGISARLRF